MYNLLITFKEPVYDSFSGTTKETEDFTVEYQEKLDLFQSGYETLLRIVDAKDNSIVIYPFSNISEMRFTPIESDSPTE